jgi:hypothetical protein
VPSVMDSPILGMTISIIINTPSILLKQIVYFLFEVILHLLKTS